METANKPLLAVLKGQIPSRRPIWFMRQAGRYLPEYRALREKAGSFLDLCYSPDLASEVTLQPLQRFDIDAAILFADILVVPHAMGLPVTFKEGEGPVLSKVSSQADVEALKPLQGSSQVAAVCGTVALTKDKLPAGVALIGFCGGPWTVASYMIEGGSSDRELAVRCAIEAESWFVGLIDRLVEESVDYLLAQIAAGADVIQIFDSWAGELSGDARQRFVIKPILRMARKIKDFHPSIPVIAFCRGIGTDHAVLASNPDINCVGIETSVPMSWARDHIPQSCAIQGNLDPVALLCSKPSLERQVGCLLQNVPMQRHVLNLGHGVRPHTSPESLETVVNWTRQYDLATRI